MENCYFFIFLPKTIDLILSRNLFSHFIRQCYFLQILNILWSSTMHDKKVMTHFSKIGIFFDSVSMET